MTGHGALRYPQVGSLEQLATAEPKLYADLPGRDILRIYADSRGDVWIATMSGIGLARWDRAQRGRRDRWVARDGLRRIR